jgi:integrase
VGEVSASIARESAISIKTGGIRKREAHNACMRDAWHAYERDALPKLAATTRRRVESRVRMRLLAIIGDVRLKDLSEADVQRVLTPIRGAVLSNRTLEDIRAILRHVRGMGWITSDPTAQICKRREIARERYLTREELACLIRALPRIPSGDLIRFLALTGCRLNEARQMMWSDLQGDVWIKRAVTTKARRAHAVPLLPYAQGLVASRPKRGSFVFSRPDGAHIGSVQKVWETALRKAELSGVRIHDLRHTIASLALQSGVGLAVVGKMLSHSSPSVTSRYAHLELEHLRDGFSRVSSSP